MCTSFVQRKNDILVAMNSDNNSMNFKIKADEQQFTLLVDGSRGKVPSFGVYNNGVFINHF
jgi:hypothetical protein